MKHKNNQAYNTRFLKFKNWWKFKKDLMTLWWQDAPRWQIDLTKGSYFIRKGALYQVGQPFITVNPVSKAKKTRYIANLYFNFKENKVTHSFSNRPIKNFSEPFINGQIRIK